MAYFMTAGTKPAQPRNGYCPHSRGAGYAFDAVPADVDPEVGPGLARSHLCLRNFSQEFCASEFS